jgi:hypothetical protein
MCARLVCGRLAGEMLEHLARLLVTEPSVFDDGCDREDGIDQLRVAVWLHVQAEAVEEGPNLPNDALDVFAAYLHLPILGRQAWCLPIR